MKKWSSLVLTLALENNGSDVSIESYYRSVIVAILLVERLSDAQILLLSKYLNFF